MTFRNRIPVLLPIFLHAGYLWNPWHRPHIGLDLRGQRGTVPAIGWPVLVGVAVSFTVQDTQRLTFASEAFP